MNASDCRRFVLALLPCAGLAFPVFSATAERPSPAVPVVPALESAAEAWKASFAVTPYLQNMGPAQVTVMWWSARPSYGWVEYGETPELGHKAETIVDGLKEANVRRHAVRLTGLKPGGRYHYRVVNRPIESFGAYKTTFLPEVATPVYSFSPPPEDANAKVSCLVFNDLHCQPKLLEPLTKLPPALAPADFVVFNGDCFADLASEEKALRVLQGYIGNANLSERPACFVRGNHETRGAFARSLGGLFENPNGRYYYAFTRGSVRFVFLDCGEDKADDHPAYSGLNDFSGFRKEVAAWLAGEIASPEFKSARWHVLIHHIPLYGDERSPLAAPFYLPELEKGTFDLAINGHTHRPALLPPQQTGNPYPILVGGGPEPKNATLIVFEADAKGFTAQLLDEEGKKLQAVSATPQ